jgi:hypothetical protein
MDESRGGAGFWTSKTGIALCVFVAIAALFLILEHRAHALQWLPYALLLACPLLHLFMHGGHGGHGGHARHADGAESRPAPRAPEDRGQGGAQGS